MERGNHAYSIDVVKLSAKLGYGRHGLHDGLCRECPETADNFGTHHWQLPAKEWITGSHFVRFRIPIIRRPALQDIANVDVFAFEIDGLDDLGQQLSGPPDKRQALLVFVETRRFTDKH